MPNPYNTKAYPLAWPKGRPRTKVRSTSKFGSRSLAVALDLVKKELARLHASYVVVSSNVPLRADGNPYSNPGRMPDPGVAVYFRLEDEPITLSCDKWNSVEENLYALAKHVEAMRGIERWGVGSVSQTFAGFKELPSSVEPDWWIVLGVGPNATRDQVLAAHREKARTAHPDRGGAAGDMQAINTARDRALATLAQ